MSSTHALSISARWMTTSRSTTLRGTTTRLATTSSPTGPGLSTPPSLATGPSHTSTATTRSSTSPETETRSTGSRPVPSHLSRIRPSVAHAGPSLPLVPSRVFTRSRQASSNLSLSNNSSHAPQRTTDATVAGNIRPLSTGSRTKLSLRACTRTPHRVAKSLHANTTRAAPLPSTFPSTISSPLKT